MTTMFWFEDWNEHLFDIGQEALAVDRTVEQAGCVDAIDEEPRYRQLTTGNRPTIVDDAEDLDLEVGNAIAIDVAADEREVIGGAGLVECLVAQLALPAAKSCVPMNLKSLVAPAAGVGVDIPEIDVIQSALEVGDDIAGGGPDRAL